MIENILTWWGLADQSHLDDGLTWYFSAETFVKDMARKYSKGVETVAGITAALSIQTNWQENKRLVELYLSSGRVAHLGMVARKIAAIEEASDKFEIAAILNGEKVSRFFFNILGHYEFVTVDRHAMRVAGIPVKKLTPNQYAEIERQYIIASNEVGVPPAALQAVTWCVYRDLNGISRIHGENR